MPSVHPATEESRGLEDRHSAGRNCDRFSGPGVAGLPGLAVSHLERAESAELDAVASHERFLRGGEKNVDYPRALPPGDSRSGRIGDLLKRGRLWSSSSPQRFGQVLSLHSDNLKGRVAPASSPRPGQPLAPCERAPRPAPMPGRPSSSRCRYRSVPMELVATVSSGLPYGARIAITPGEVFLAVPVRVPI